MRLASKLASICLHHVKLSAIEHGHAQMCLHLWESKDILRGFCLREQQAYIWEWCTVHLLKVRASIQAEICSRSRKRIQVHGIKLPEVHPAVSGLVGGGNSHHLLSVTYAQSFYIFFFKYITFPVSEWYKVLLSAPPCINSLYVCTTVLEVVLIIFLLKSVIINVFMITVYIFVCWN